MAVGVKGVDDDGGENLALGKQRQAMLNSLGEPHVLDGMCGSARLRPRSGAGFALTSTVPLSPNFDCGTRLQASICCGPITAQASTLLHAGLLMEESDGEGTPPNASEPIREDALVKVDDQALAARMPKTLLALRQITPSDVIAYSRLRVLSGMDASDEDIAAIITASARASRPWKFRHQYNLIRHRASHVWSHKNPITRAISLIPWAVLLTTSTLHSGLGIWGYICGACVIVGKMVHGWREIDPSHLPDFQRTLNERQFMLYRLIHTQQTWTKTKPTDREVDSFRRDALALIALYVRDHRVDLRRRKIFVSLLVQVDESIVVIARSDGHRKVPQRYSTEQCSLASQCIQTGRRTVTGDLYADAPQTEAGKPYKSVLTLPVIFKDQILGSVSIDSVEPFHFEGYEEELEANLAPYVQLLAPTLVSQKKLVSRAAKDLARSLPEDQHHVTHSQGNGEASK